MTYAIVVIAVLILDQAVKYWTNTTLAVGESQAFIPGFIEILHTQNKGAAFGFLKNVEFARWLFVALVVIFSIAVIYMLSKNIVKGSLGRWMLVLIMAGGLGNCIDRIVSGYVVDMFHFTFKIFGYDFPVFNIADIFLTVCGVIFCVWLIIHKSETPEAPAPKPPARSRRRAEEKSEPAPNDDYITQLKKPVVRARVDLEQQRAAAAAAAAAETQQRTRAETQQGTRAETQRRIKAEAPQRAKAARPQAPATDTGDAFAEFFGKSGAEPDISSPARAEAVSKPVISAPPPMQKKSDTDFSLDDILAEFSDK